MGEAANIYDSTNHQLEHDIMNLDTYTQHIPLTQKARFWGNFVSALKGSNDLYAAPEPYIRHYYPSIVETMPGADARLKNGFGRLEDLMWRGRRGTSLPPTPVLAEANDRIHTLDTTTVLCTQISTDPTETETEELV